MFGMCATSGVSAISVLHPAASDGKPAFDTLPSSRFFRCSFECHVAISLSLEVAFDSRVVVTWQ